MRHRVAGGGHPPPAPTEPSVRISRTALVRSGFTVWRQLRVRDMELRFKQRELRLDPLELLPRDRAALSPTGQYFAPIAFHGPMDL